MDQDFLNNEIYQYLITKKSSILVSIIDTTYQHCEYILGEIPKEFSNYTIHDIHHAIRVINYMTEFVKPNINEYSHFHLALILLVGLLHDIGMFVSDDEKKEILSRIIAKDKNNNQQELFQDYIRERHSKRVGKILEDYVLDENTNSKLSSIFRLDAYNFSADIALICQSHTESLEWVEENLDVTKYITKYDYNPQQIALLLKLSDNLDIDARRAPYSLLKLLEIKGYSETEWKKHSPIKNYKKIKYAENQFHIYFSGDCDNAFIYRKVMDHILWLQNTCSEIKTLASKYDQPYRFDLDEKFAIKIETKGFEATNLRFSLDYSSVLKLLMGEQIYGEKKAGLRELLQNSIDAVMVMRERLSDKKTTNYQPTIWIEMNKDQNTISVCDNGIGMSKNVLEKYFFNIGKSYYTSNDYKKLNLNYSAIGHFGIGFLACFMLSSNVRMETQAVGQKPIVIEFEKASQFVTELKNHTCIFDEGHGTRIHLSYDEIIPNIFESEKKLADYVEKLLFVNGYEVKILDSLHKIKIIENSVNTTYRHISTNELDIYYSINGHINSWSDFSEVMFNSSFVFLCCKEYDLETNTKSLIVDLEELDRLLYIYADVFNKLPLTDYLDEMKVSDQSIRNFLLSFYKISDTPESLRARINKYIFSKLYKNGKMTFYSFSHNVIANDWSDIRWSSMDDSDNIALIGLTNKDIREYEEYDSGFLFKIKQILDYEHDLDIDLYHYGPEEVSLYVLKSYETDVFLPVETDAYISNSSVYMHGILVRPSIIFPYFIFGNSDLFRSIIVNVKSDIYELNVSRNDFNRTSKDKLFRDVSREVLIDFANNTENIDSDIGYDNIWELIDIIDLE